jgi:hypothetical protein
MPEAKRSLGNLSPAIQVVVKNRMNLDNNHWEHFFKFNPADGTFSSIGNAMGVSPLELTALLTLARSCMIHTSPAPDPQVSTLLAGLMDLLKSQPAVRKEAPATMPPPEDEQALRQRLSLELEAKKLFEYHKRITSELLKAVPIFNRERDVVTLDFFLTNLVAAWTSCFPKGSDAEKITFLRQRSSGAAILWMNSLSPAPTTADEWLETIRKEHSIEDEESSARITLQALRLTPPIRPEPSISTLRPLMHCYLEFLS